jgi:hypothetical protein
VFGRQLLVTRIAWQAKGKPAQLPIPWRRDRWIAALPEHEATLRSLPDRLGRDDVRTACRGAAVDPVSAVGGFVAVMVWGFGRVGYGPDRTHRMLATPDAPGRLHAVAETLASEGPPAAYRRLATSD